MQLVELAAVVVRGRTLAAGAAVRRPNHAATATAVINSYSSPLHSCMHRFFSLVDASALVVFSCVYLTFINYRQFFCLSDKRAHTRTHAHAH